MNILGVQQIPLTVREDGRGYLFEVIHNSDPFMTQFGQVYVVGDRLPMIVRAFHKHGQLHDWFCVIKGSAKFVLVDDRETSSTFQAVDILIGSDRAQSLIVVPPGVYHGWMSLEPDTIMVSIASHEYNRKGPDEHRVPPDFFNNIIGEDPWEIKGE
jgi:dTDP-4-dehydrorhamnose 3,5-epimerase